MNHTELRVETNRERVVALLDEVMQIANGEKEALGFIPEGAYREAAQHGRLVVAQSGLQVAGFIMFGGVFPHARVQQIGVAPSSRRSGVGTFLISHLIERLEREGFLTIKARVARDLSAAQAFYAKNGFEDASIVVGGEARRRVIVVRVRHLDSPSLLDAAGRAVDWASSRAPIALRRSRPGEAHFYVIDLNVLFDLVRDRNRSQEAHSLFRAALSHSLRIAVAAEFLAELTRTSTDLANDPLLALASQLPRLPKVPKDELCPLADKMHAVVFERARSKASGSPRARSDSRHLAHATIAGAAGFITSDGEILAARDCLLADHGLDVATLDELVSLLPSDTPPLPRSTGQGFECRPLSPDAAEFHLRSLGADSELVSTLCPGVRFGNSIHRYAIFEEDRILALGILVAAGAVDAPTRLFVQCSQNHESADLFAEHLFDILLSLSTKHGPAIVELHRLPGQTLVSRVAEAKGFFDAGTTLAKIALGCPLTPTNWDHVATKIRRMAGVEIVNSPSAGKLAKIRDGERTIHDLTPKQLEDLLAPTILASDEREGVIVSIKKAYADDLLGTSNQPSLAFVESKPAAFLTRRDVSSPRNALLMRPAQPILFYESDRSGGRGAIVAVGRIVDTFMQSKSAVSADSKRRLVVDEVDPFSASNDVLVTTFDNILRFPKPYLRRELAEINALGTNNLQAATAISGDNLRKVLDAAWSYT